MTLHFSNAAATTRPTAPSPRARVACWTLITCSTMACVAGCRSRLNVIPADRIVTFLPAGQTYTATQDTYLVPPARMQEILRALNNTNR